MSAQNEKSSESYSEVCFKLHVLNSRIVNIWGEKNHIHQLETSQHLVGYDRSAAKIHNTVASFMFAFCSYVQLLLTTVWVEHAVKPQLNSKVQHFFPWARKEARPQSTLYEYEIRKEDECAIMWIENDRKKM